jgi:hypothetical protein
MGNKQGQGTDRPRLAAWLAVFLVAPAAAILPGCETNDPCALRKAACLDVVLVGKHDDGQGNPIAYKGLTVKVCASNPANSAINPMASCNPTPPAPMTMCDQTVPCGEELASSPMPLNLTAVGSYSANLQDVVTFQLPDTFNARADTPIAPILDSCPDTDTEINELKMLRGLDPRAIRIQVLQAGQTAPVWDSRCDEYLFSPDQWTMLNYYRVGKNEYRSVYATLSQAVTSPP